MLVRFSIVLLQFFEKVNDVRNQTCIIVDTWSYLRDLCSPKVMTPIKLAEILLLLRVHISAAFDDVSCIGTVSRSLSWLFASLMHLNHPSFFYIKCSLPPYIIFISNESFFLKSLYATVTEAAIILVGMGRPPMR